MKKVYETCLRCEHWEFSTTCGSMEKPEWHCRFGYSPTHGSCKEQAEYNMKIINSEPTDDGHFTDDPLDVINAEPDFSDIGLNWPQSSEEIEKMADEMFETVKEILRKNAWAGMFPSED